MRTLGIYPPPAAETVGAVPRAVEEESRCAALLD